MCSLAHFPRALKTGPCGSSPALSTSSLTNPGHSSSPTTYSFSVSAPLLARHSLTTASPGPTPCSRQKSQQHQHQHQHHHHHCARARARARTHACTPLADCPHRGETLNSPPVTLFAQETTWPSPASPVLSEPGITFSRAHLLADSGCAFHHRNAVPGLKSARHNGERPSTSP